MPSDTPRLATADLRTRVLDVARGIIATGGLAAMTIARLSTESGMSNGSMYHHFGSRGAIIGELCLEAFVACLQPVSAELDDRPAAVAVPAMAAAYVGWCCGDRARATLLYEGIAEVEHPARLLAAKCEAFAPVATWFEQRVRAGEVRAVTPDEIDPIVMAPAHECVRRDLLSDGAWSAASMAPAIGRAVWRIVQPGAGAHA